MALQLFAHPFSSYCQKVLIALYENDTPFEYRLLSDPEVGAELSRLWPIAKFPLLVDGNRPVMEASIIIEYLGLHYPGPVRLIPEDREAALEVRLMDRFFDNYVMAPQQRVVFDALRAEKDRDALGVQQARAMLETSYRWLDNVMRAREWAAGPQFSMADCVAAPALFYADWTHAIGPEFTHVHAYRRRLLARPSFSRAVDEARPYRAGFPLGAPDRD